MPLMFDLFIDLLAAMSNDVPGMASPGISSLCDSFELQILLETRFASSPAVIKVL